MWSHCQTIPKRPIIKIAILGICSIAIAKFLWAADSQKNRFVSPQQDSDFQRFFKQASIIDQGDLLLREGSHNDAILKYQEALGPSFVKSIDDRVTPIGRLQRAYKLLGEYSKAQEQLQWFIDHNNIPDIQEQLKEPEDLSKPLEIVTAKDAILREQRELEALIKARDADSPKPIYEHVKYLQMKYERYLPPKNCPAGMCDTIFSVIVRLYDHVGDYDAGIAFTEEFLKFYKKIGPGDPYQLANPHFQVKQAFLQDKADGRKNCITAKPGEACMGHATKALIDSDYFPW